MQLEIIKNNYLYVPGFITKDEAHLLANQFKEHCRKFNIQGDSQAPNSHAMYNFLPFVKSTSTCSVITKLVLFHS